MGFYIPDESENKININLSSYAYYIMECDIASFSDTENAVNRNFFVNTIVNNLAEAFDLWASDENFILSKEKGEHFTVFLKVEVRKKLKAVSEKISNVFGGSIPLYLKNIMEYYSTRTYIEREKIYFRNKVDMIRSAVKLGDETVKINDKIILHPYDILPDEWSAYNYIIGVCADKQNPRYGKLLSFRLSFCECTSCIESVSKFSKEQRRFIHKQITDFGVQFISECNSSVIEMIPDCIRSEIKIRLSMTGKRMFDRMIFMRPRPKDITPVENGFIYTFDCTQRQADYYFFRFGVDAEILEPQDLREKFATKHKCAADLYNPI